MDIDPNEIVTVELRWDNDGLPETYSRDITRRRLGDLLLQLDDMTDTTTAAAQEDVA
ncbi:hypothetical protein [Streptomyces sp. PR69]|uniref:hypothetical protein n=1 Tax=Streptomyces sp. PR69 TaxID=2984950 RepID=UPI0022653207|nr:hypothetical protein [Streptomyces sp. PR69]